MGTEFQTIRAHRERPTVAGASSFTGMAILERLHMRGWKPIGLTRAGANETSGIKKWRLERLKAKGIDIIEGVRSEDGTMAEWVLKHSPKYWIHHFHMMDRFRSPDYDVQTALATGLHPLERLVKALAQSGCRGVVYSGSYFEPGEGGQSISAGVTPYAETKRQIWLTLKELVDRSQMPLAKVVIPNPIGPGENPDRLIPLLVQKSGFGGGNETLELKAPSATAENLPVQLLAEVYEMAIQDFAAAGEDASLIPVFYRPSVGPMTHLDFVHLVNQALLVKELGRAEVPISTAAPAPGFSPTSYHNGNELRMRVQWDSFWKDYAAQLKQGPLLQLYSGTSP